MLLVFFFGWDYFVLSAGFLWLGAFLCFILSHIVILSFAHRWMVLTHLFVTTMLELSHYLNLYSCVTYLQIWQCLKSHDLFSVRNVCITSYMVLVLKFFFFRNRNTILKWIYSWRVNKKKFYWIEKI